MIIRLKAASWSEYEASEKRGPGARRFLCIWAYGVYFEPRMAETMRSGDRVPTRIRWQRTSGHDRRFPQKHTALARRAARSQATWSGAGSEAGNQRRRPGFQGHAAQDVSHNPRTAVLAAQHNEGARRDAEIGSGQGTTSGMPTRRPKPRSHSTFSSRPTADREQLPRQSTNFSIVLGGGLAPLRRNNLIVK